MLVKNQIIGKQQARLALSSIAFILENSLYTQVVIDSSALDMHVPVLIQTCRGYNIQFRTVGVLYEFRLQRKKRFSFFNNDAPENKLVLKASDILYYTWSKGDGAKSLSITDNSFTESHQDALVRHVLLEGGELHVRRLEHLILCASKRIHLPVCNAFSSVFEPWIYNTPINKYVIDNILREVGIKPTIFIKVSTLNTFNNMCSIFESTSSEALMKTNLGIEVLVSEIECNKGNPVVLNVNYTDIENGEFITTNLNLKFIGKKPDPCNIEPEYIGILDNKHVPIYSKSAFDLRQKLIEDPYNYNILIAKGNRLLDLLDKDPTLLDVMKEFDNIDLGTL